MKKTKTTGHNVQNIGTWELTVQFPGPKPTSANKVDKAARKEARGGNAGEGYDYVNKLRHLRWRYVTRADATAARRRVVKVLKAHGLPCRCGVEHVTVPTQIRAKQLMYGSLFGQK